MARVKNLNFADVLPYMGNTFMLKNWRGLMYAASWPKKRGRKQDIANKYRNEWFRIANQMAAQAAPAQQRAAMLFAPKGPLYPRDYLLSAMAGKMYIINLEDGRTLYPMSLVNEISKDFDVIAQVRGMIVYRGQKVWQPLAIGGYGEYVRPRADGLEPEWGPFDEESGGLTISAIPPVVVDTTSNATFGWWGFLGRKIRVIGMQPTWEAILSAKYECTIVILDGSTIDSIVATTENHTAPLAGFRRIVLTPDSFPVLDLNIKYAFLFTRTDSTATAQAKMYTSTDTSSKGLPLSHNCGHIRFASNKPTVGQIASSIGTNQVQYPVDLLYRS